MLKKLERNINKYINQHIGVIYKDSNDKLSKRYHNMFGIDSIGYLFLNMDTALGLDWSNYKLHLNVNENMLKFLKTKLELKVKSKSGIKINNYGISCSVKEPLYIGSDNKIYEI